MQFPDCSDADAISVACLDLCYTVKIRSQMKDERKDNVTPLVLSDLSPEDQLGLEEEEEGGRASGLGAEEGVEEEKVEEGEGSGFERLPSRYQKMKRGERGLYSVWC